MQLTFDTLDECPNSPAIYVLRMGKDAYVGQAKRVRRRLREYIRNCKNLNGGGHYRPSDPCGFRRVHKRLAEAFAGGEAINIELLLLDPRADMYAAERYMILAVRPNLNVKEKRSIR